MVIAYGTRNYGLTDYVPGASIYVMTQFQYFQFFPLVPVRSYIFLSENHGIPIGLHWKSVLLAWTRALLCVAAIFFAVVGLICWNDRNGVTATSLVIAVAAVALWIASCFVPYLGYASYEMARTAGLSQGHINQINSNYGRLGADDAHHSAQQGKSSGTSQDPTSQPPPTDERFHIDDRDNPYRRM